ncbi:hypothetical protein JK386_13855 [Nocardioides sp. zg-536]|uniref:Uncharacterized protein n=1 Tax=Nocardioides faecalis TaxID=2803858 RepID=A0A938Y331_9ACTN|nr:hypothetical protein [Nocardioides faecalis]MBM9460981.1 hypothetical protein [Nocardioides faecalis]QVI59200.1 hypothetical protein KG111_02110 [Nocardioides faecalis]
MRVARIITVLLAAFTATMLGLTLAPANAAAPTGERATRHVVDPLTAAEIRNSGKFYVKGKARTAKGKVVYLQSKRKGQNWRTVKKTRSSKASGYFRMTFRGKCGTYFRVIVKKSGGYATNRTKIGRIVCY